MMTSGLHAAQIEREQRGGQWFWPGVYLNPIHFAPGSRLLHTAQELPKHAHSILLPGIQFPASSVVTFKAIGFHPPLSAIGIKLRSLTPGGALHTGRKGYHVVPFDCSIVRMVLLADQPGLAVFDIYRTTQAQMLAGNPPGPPQSIISEAEFRPQLGSVVADTVIGPSQSAIDTTLMFWNTTLHRGDVICFDLLSFTGVTSLTLTLLVARNSQP